MEETKASSEFLHFGELISICLEDDCYIFSKGFIDNSVYLQQLDNTASYDFSGAVFRVLPQCMYSVQNDLLSASEELPQKQFNEKFARHEESLEGEIKTNIQTYNNFKGEPVRFGSIIQLQHVMSYKFITLVPEENAEIEKENLRLRLKEFASERSYIRIEPGYKFQKESDGLVRINDRVVFEIMLPDLIKSAYFNTSDYSTSVKSELLQSESMRREVNASLDHKVKWKLKLFSKYIPEKENSLLCGDHIWLTHSEEESCLVANSRVEINNVSFNTNMNDTNGLWKIEYENEKEGGYVITDKLYRLRHASTGLYLSVEQDEGKIKNADSFTKALFSKMTKQTVYAICLGQKENPFTLWKFQPLHNNKKPRKVCRDDFCVLLNNESGTCLHGIIDKKNEHDTLLVPMLRSEVSEDAYFKVFKCDDSMTWGTLFLLDCMPILTDFPGFIEKHSKATITYDNLPLIREFKKNTDLVLKCLENLILFCKNKLKSMITVDKQFGHVEAVRQKILREQLFIDALSEILSNIFIGNFGLSKIMTLGKLDQIELENKSKKLKDPTFQVNKNHLQTIFNIGKKIYQLLSVICKRNRENQIYSSRFFKVFQKHAAYGLGATDTIKTILDENELLLLQVHKPQGLNTDRQNDSIISHYAWLLRKFYRERKPQLVDFLRFICTYKGEGLSVNQEKIHEMLFGNPETHSKAVITTSTLSEKMTLYVFLQHPSGVGEENVSLESCFSNGEIEPKFFNEIQYFTRMLELFSDMCTGRNYICKASIKDWFPIQVLVSNIWNETLSPEIRAAFMKLMLNMHVDSQPREESKKPELIRVLGLLLKEDQKIIHRQRHSIVNLDTGLDIAKRMSKRFTHVSKNSHGQDDFTEDFIVRFVEDELILSKLKESILIFLQEEAISPKFNVLTHQVLKMGRKLAKFEVLGVACSNSKEGFCILDPRHKLYSYEEMDLIRLLRVVNPLLMHGFEFKKEDIGRSKSAAPKKPKKKANESFESLLNKLLHEANSLGDAVVRYSDNLRNFLRSYLSNNEFSNEEERSFENKCKIEICQLLHYVIDWRQDFLLNNVVTWFNTVFLEKPLNEEKEIICLFPPIIPTQKVEVKSNFLNLNINFDLNNLKKKLEFNREVPPEFKKYIEPEIKDLSCMGQEIVSKLLRIFCMSSDYKMQSLVMNLVLRSFNQRTELLKNIKKLHVMTVLQDTEVFTWTKMSLFTFKQLTEQSELWMKYWLQTPFMMEKNLEKLETVQSILDKFSIIMYHETSIEEGVPEIGKKSVIDKDRQLMCFHLYLHILIMHLIRDGMYALSEIYNDPKNSKEIEGRQKLLKLFKTCFEVLTLMVKKNSKIQKKMVSYLMTITDFLSVPVGQIELICEIFRDNKVLCSGVKEDFLKQFIELIMTEGRQERFLTLFEVIQSPNDTPLPEIQRMVLLLLLNPNTITHVCYMNQGLTSFTFEHMQNPPLFSSHYKDEPIRYHAVLINVLTKCGQGISGVYLTEAKCQKIISLSQIFELLNKHDPKFELLQIPLLSFFYHIYLDSEQKVEELENSKDLANYIIKATSNLNQIANESEIDPKLYDIWVKIIYKYREKYAQNANVYKIHDEAEILANFLETFASKWHLFSNVYLSEETYSMLDSLGAHFQLNFSKPIGIEDIFCPTMYHFDISNTKEKWVEFKNIALYSESLRKYLSEEHAALYTLIFDIDQLEEGLSSAEIFKKLISFVRQSPTYKPPLFVLTSVLKFLSAVISKVKCNKDEHDKEEPKSAAIQRIQDQFCEYGAAKVVLGLMCDRETEDSAFTSLLYFSIKLLEGGNEKVQQDFYQFFITMQSSNIFFERAAKIINLFIEKIEYTEEKGRVPLYKMTDSRINNVLELLRLCCENHNSLLQNYLRLQTNSRNNHDMVSLTILLLEELMKKKFAKHFSILSQCFDNLTEYIQGPCSENQKAIIDSKFLEIASGLLSIDEKTDDLSKYENLVGESTKNYAGDTRFKGWMVAHLKYKCMITIMSLLEGQSDNYVITRMIRALNIEIFKENLISNYMLYLETYKKGYYDYPLFNHYDGNDDYQYGENNEQDRNPEKFKFIIETGFLIYHLMCCFKDNDDPENKAIIENELPELMVKEEASDFIATKLIGDLGKIGLDLFKSGFSVVSRLARSKKVKEATVMNEEDRKKVLDEAYKFFQVNSGNVEVIFTNKKLFKVYFWIPPECHHFTEESKANFHDKVDRSSDKAKIQFITQQSMDLIEEMQHEFRLYKFFTKYQAISFFTSHVTVWKELAFIMTLFLNFIIIASFYQLPSGDRNTPSLFYGNDYGLSPNSTQTMIKIAGLIQCICSILIVTFFIMKTGPVLIQRGWRAHESKNVKRGFIRTIFYKLKNMFLTLYFTLSNIDVLYHLLYMSFSILGISGLTLFFSLHLLDILYRYPSLQNVIKSIVIPRKSLSLTFILILILIYLFSIWAYLGFSEFYLGNCDNMIMCLKTTFDQGIKNGGGIGQYLDNNVYQLSNGSIVENDYDIVTRFFFDDLFNIIIMIIMMNIIQGIIIDTFALLREQSDKNADDRENKCFICGKDREYIERCTNRPFRYHCVYEHNEWNYIFFIAYLFKKESTEHSGVESQIYNLIKAKDISWIPQQQGLTLKDTDNTEELQLFQKIDNIAGTYENIQKEMKDVKKYFTDYLESKQIVSE